MIDRPSPPATMGPGCDYPGTKRSLYRWIISHLPPHSIYVEPFAGKAAVFRHKPPALRSYLIDRDPDVIAWLQARRFPAAIAARGDGTRFVELLAEWHEATQDVLIYIDPPYVLSTRSGKRLYKHEMTDDDHVRLLLAATNCSCQVAISGYPSQLYDDFLDDWQKLTCRSMTRGGLRTECLWLNFLEEPSPRVSMEYFELGGNFRERERVSRKVKRWREHFERLDDVERRALLLALLESEQRRKP